MREDCLILALDTATPVGSVALCAAEGLVVSRYFDVGLQHSQRLFVEIDAALEIAGTEVGDLAAVAISIGPGSFTGLRIGLGAAKGLCLGADKPLVAISTLETLAARLPFARLPVCAVLDARKKEVYAALYDTASGVPIELVAPRAVNPALLAEERVGQQTLYTGDGAEVYRDLWSEDALLAPAFCARPDAATLGWLALSKLAEGATADLAALEPEYLRAPDAKLPSRA